MKDCFESQRLSNYDLCTAFTHKIPSMSSQTSTRTLGCETLEQHQTSLMLLWLNTTKSTQQCSEI